MTTLLRSDTAAIHLRICTRLRYLGSVKVHYFPARFRLMEHDGSSVDKSSPVIQMKRHNRDIAKHLNLHVPRLNMHVWRRSLAAANLFEYDFECLFELSPPVCALGEPTGKEHGGIIGESQAESFPV